MKRVIIISSLTFIIALLNINFVAPNLDRQQALVEFEQVTAIDTSAMDSSKIVAMLDSLPKEKIYFGRGSFKMKEAPAMEKKKK
jgi:hypothetical protein